MAKAAGVNVEAVRFYQRNGLISELDRPRRGHTPLWATCHSALDGLVRLRDLGAGPNRTEIMQAWATKVCAEVSAILADVAHRSH